MTNNTSNYLPNNDKKTNITKKNKKELQEFRLGKITRLLLIKKDSKFAMFSDQFHSLKTIRMPITEIENIDDLNPGNYLSLFIYKDNNPNNSVSNYSTN